MGAVGEVKLPYGDQGFPPVQTGGDLSHAVAHQAGLHRHPVGDVVLVQGIDILAVHARLDGFRGDDDHVVLGIRIKGHLGEHPRQQSLGGGGRHLDGHRIEMGGGVGGGDEVLDGALKRGLGRVYCHGNLAAFLQLADERFRHPHLDFHVRGGLDGSHRRAGGDKAVFYGGQRHHGAGNGSSDFAIAVDVGQGGLQLL